MTPKSSRRSSESFVKETAAATGDAEVVAAPAPFPPAVISPLTTVAYVIGTDENFASTGGSISNSSGSKGVLYKPNL